MESNKFVYIDAFGERGLFAFFWCVIEVLHLLNESDKLYVDLRKIPPYYDANYKETDNVWEYYFEQPCGLTSEDDCTPIKFDRDMVSKMIFSLRGGKYNLQISEEAREIANRIIQKCIRFKPHIHKKVEDFYGENFKDKTILGVHARGGLHFTTGHGRGQSHLMNMEYYFDRIDKELYNFDKLFLITPDMPIRNAFIEKYGDKLVFYNSDLLVPISGIELAWEHRDRNYEKGEVAVVESILLSKCSKMLVTGGNLSCLSIFLTDSEYEWIDEHITYS